MKKLIIIFLLLFGCTKQWTKIGFSEQEFARDQIECETLAANVYPPSMVSEQKTIGDATTSCTTIGAYTNCDTTPPYSYTSSYDRNESERKKYVENCLIAKGYFEEEKDIQWY